jgi:hypothetical protein
MSDEPKPQPQPDDDQPDDRSLPIDVHFPDQRSLTVDIDVIMRNGLRMRRNRKAFVGVVAAVAAGVLGVSAATLAPMSSSSAHVVNAASPTGTQQSNVLREIIPGVDHVTILGSRANPMAGSTLSAVAWLSGGGPCFGATDLTKTSTSDSSYTCIRRPSALSSTKPTVLAPQVVAGVTDDTGSQLMIGFVSGDVTKVSLKIRGHLYDAAVAALFGSPSTGAYMVWASAADGVVTGGQDFTQITGYNSHGVLVAGAQP